MTEGYCMKCKVKKEMNDVVITENTGRGGVIRNIAIGKCPACGTKMARILGVKAKAPETVVPTPANKGTTSP